MHRHFTATVFIIDSQQRVLLLWHKRLARWMPPGGHVDPNELPEETAVRECKEETGLDVEILSASGADADDAFRDEPSEGRMLKQPFAMLLEHIPAYEVKNEPAHQHMDFLFRARPLDETQALVIAAAEADHLRWCTREEVAALDARTEIFSNVQRTVLQTVLPPVL